MTRKLYNQNSYQRKFRATVLDKKIKQETSALILDQSYFYPNAGGQLCDKGAIEGLPVIDVQELDGDIIHYIKGNISINQGDIITGEIDWESRFDHMQQHSGQHVLSGILMSIWQKETLSFHMGEEICTLDIPYTSLDEKKAEHLEEMANQVIYDNKTIRQYYLEDNNGITGKLRKKQELHGKLRVVEIDEFDLTACGGTHCKSTGEIAIIKIIGWEKHKDKTRISFLCGHRAFADYRKKHKIIKHLSGFFTVGINQLEEKVDQLSKEKYELTKGFNRIEKELIQYEAEGLKVKYSKNEKDYFLVSKLFFEKSVHLLRQISLMLINEQKCLVIIGAEKPEPVICLACSQDFNIHMGELVKQIMIEYNGKGGGSNFMAVGKLKSSADLSKVFNKATKLIFQKVQ
ncbi:MAG: alanyl-tRNA editing protein [Atribacterota bacterium]